MITNKSYITLLMISYFFCQILFSQEPTGSVLISDEEAAMESSAILQVSSTKKGVLYPRMTFEAASNIENKKDGLMVFITDSAKLGYWYWKATDAKWMQIRDAESGYQDVEAPLGGIIMYSGRVDNTLFDSKGRGLCRTKMEGWQICNSDNDYGAPDLSGRFIMGDVTVSSPRSGGNDSIKLTADNLPVHTHGTNSINGFVSEHIHKITDITHRHRFTVTWKKIGATKRSYNFELRESGDIHNVILKESADIGEIKIQMMPATDQINYTISDLNPKQFVKNTGKGKGIDNRPSYYVLLYLMRINNDYCPATP